MLRHPQYLDGRQLKVVGLSAQRTGRLYYQEIPLLLIFVRGCVDRKDLVNKKFQSGIEPATFRLTAQCLSQLREHFMLKEEQRFKMDDNLVL
jgi:hypothetical protein